MLLFVKLYLFIRSIGPCRRIDVHHRLLTSRWLAIFLIVEDIFIINKFFYIFATNDGSFDALQNTLMDFLRRFTDTSTSYVCCIRPSSSLSSSSSSRYDPVFVQKQVHQILISKPSHDIWKPFSFVHWCDFILFQF